MTKVLKLLVLSGSLMVLPIAVLAADSGWTPNAKDIAHLESVMNLSRAQNLGGPPPMALTKYVRFYAGVVVHGRRMIRGVLLLGTPAGTRIVPEKSLPSVMDGAAGL